MILANGNTLKNPEMTPKNEGIRNFAELQFLNNGM